MAQDRIIRAATTLVGLLACLPATAAPKIEAAAPPGQVFLLSAYPAALCNDGTPGAYYFRKSNTGSTKWLFYLEGGEECHDDKTCTKTANNSPNLVSSSLWSVKKPQGIISPNKNDNPTFYSANIVQVHYCSSDYWSGAKAATTTFTSSNADSGWNFLGRAIALAALQDLAAQDATTGFSAATDILFAGSSAGGLGIVYNLNDLLPYAPAAAHRLLAVDAGFSLQIDGFAPTAPPTYMTTSDPLATIITDGMSFWNGHGDTPCAQAAMTQQAASACFQTSMLLAGGYIPIPAFIAQSELDTDQLSQHYWKGTVTQDTAHMTYATEFADAMKASLQATAPVNSVFAPQRLNHVMFTENSQFDYQEMFPGMTESPSMALGAWYAQPTQAFGLYGDQAMLP
jgi:hypothetical protein